MCVRVCVFVREAGAAICAWRVNADVLLFFFFCCCRRVHVRTGRHVWCVRTYCSVCTLCPIIHAFVGARARDSDLFLSRLINEEIKVSASQSRHKDTGRRIRHPAATSEILISPSLYFSLRGHTALWLSLRSRNF